MWHCDVVVHCELDKIEKIIRIAKSDVLAKVVGAFVCFCVIVYYHGFMYVHIYIHTCICVL